MQRLSWAAYTSERSGAGTFDVRTQKSKRADRMQSAHIKRARPPTAPLASTLKSVILATSVALVVAQLARANQLVPARVGQFHQQQQHLPSAAQQQRAHALDLMSSATSNAPNIFRDLSGPTSGKIQTLDVICGKNFMTVRAEFSGPFYGIVFSKGTYGEDNCVYVKPNSGLTHTAFNVQYDKCGTKPDTQGRFYENTIVIQYGSDIIEAYDEAKRLRCEWFEEYEKPATFKPAIPVADLEVVEMNFQGDDIDCWMEIQEGTGPTSREVSKIVPVGQPMTIVVAINDYNGQFDMRVKSCIAHDGQQQPIALTDEFGCVLRPKMLTPFAKVRNPGGVHKKATILSYARFLAFKFPDSMTVQIQCTVEVCRHGCADACQRIPSIAATTMQPELSLTAKWPAASNQPAFISADSFPERVHLRQSAPAPAPALAPALASSSSDDMSGSESSQQPAAVARAPAIPAAQPAPQQQRRPQELYAPPHYANRRVPQMPLHGARLPSSTTTGAPITTTVGAVTSTTAAPTTTSTSSSASPESDEASGQEESNRAGGQAQPQGDSESASGESMSEESLTRLQAAVDTMNANVNLNANIGESQTFAQDSAKSGGDSGGGESSSAAESQSSQDRMDNKAEASAVKPAVVEAPVSQAPATQSGELTPAGAPSAEVKPSVQGDDGLQLPQSSEPSSKQSSSSEQSQPSGGSSSSSDLKTVEVEIPADESDPLRTFVAQSGGVQSQSESQQQQQQSQSQSSNGYSPVRSLSGETGAGEVQPSSYESPVVFENSRFQSDRSQDSVIQPREKADSSSSSAPKSRAKSAADSDEANFEQLMGGSGKIRFGARSQPQSHSAAAPDTQSGGDQLAAIAPASANQRGDSSASLLNSTPDVLVDRSDESSELLAEESSQSSSVRAIRPVVGTDELATGPVQLEDRMGNSAPRESQSLEEALTRIQQSLPHTAALISGGSNPAGQASPGSAEERVDLTRKTQSFKDLASQPHPNVAGQTKVLPDPSSGLMASSAAAKSTGLQTQASQTEGVAVPAKPAPVSISGANQVQSAQQSQIESQSQQQQQQQHQQQQQQQQQHQQHQQQQQQKPVAQITNVPMNINFAPNQLPAIQQLQQQLAQQFQQQQQAQAHQQQQQTAAKPSRGRFNLLSPQAALHAVASRLLPKSSTNGQQQQQQQQQQPQRLSMINQQLIPQLLNNMQQLSPEQQAKLFAQAQAQQFSGSATPVNQPSQSKPAGLFTRLTSSLSSHNLNQQQQPLVRQRRSLASSGKNKGEVGVTRSFMVVTGLDLAFAPSSLNETELPQILEGRRLMASEEDVIYGVCMPIVSLTFVLTCAFWLLVFLITFCIYLLVKARRQRQAFAATKLPESSECSHSIRSDGSQMSM